MMRAGYALRESRLGIKRLIIDESGIATLISIGYGLINIGLTGFGTCGGQAMKTLSLVYRWCWGGIC